MLSQGLEGDIGAQGRMGRPAVRGACELSGERQQCLALVALTLYGRRSV